MKYGIEFEFFVSKKGKIVPAYFATNNLDGNPFLGEIRTEPFDRIVDCVFNLQRLIFEEKQKLESRGFKMCIIPKNVFSKEDIIDFRKNQIAINLKSIEKLEEFSIYSNKELGKILNVGEIKASLQINFSNHKNFNYVEYQKITVEDKSRYETINKNKSYSCLFNYVDIIQKLDIFFDTDIMNTERVKGIYAIKDGQFGDRIEYRSLPNTINYIDLIKVLN